MTNPLDVAQWAKNWEALARQAGEGLAGKSAQFPWQGATQSGPAWAELLGKSAPFADANRQSEAIEHMLAGAQGYLGMLQSLAMAASGQGTAPDSGFSDALRQGVFPGAFSASSMNNPLAAAMRGFGGQGAQGLEQMMERFAATTGPLFDSAKGVLNAPAFGHLREKQETLQNAARLMIDYQEQSARYDRLMLKVSEKSFARFQLKLAEREEPGRQVDSVRGLYDLWIDAAEEAYAEVALSEEFREVYAGVVDAQMRLRKHVQGEIEKLCAEFGMPTRSEVDSIGQRLQALRREFREEREAGTDNEELAAELDSLRRELAGLKSGQGKQAGKAKSGKSTRAAVVAKSGKARKPARADKASTPVREKKPAKATKASKPAKSGKSGKSGKSKKLAKAVVPVQDQKASVAAESPKRKSSAAKSKRKAVTKETRARRTKRRKSTPAKGSVVAAKAPDSKSGQPASFAASIARFARKSKNSSAGTTRSRGVARAAKRGGSK
ncbi:class III poly(R)-hydroxyalkanoic acid synthase subunit PhaE [Dokdonella sp.]|uniref:class III poly(R)-hydroxyalkanoic acid synthase subunit PhaE n=1 Tax=Dokdonella sp. TaxID=2291710 RepID=UPI0035296F29